VKLEYNHSGRQFFFLTLTVAGHEAILSRLVDEKTRPVPTEIGKVVKAALLALHLANEAVTVSDFVIMPDHFHFIMIVDYGRDKTASPLYLAHRLLDAVEWYLERTGALAPPNPACGGVGFWVGRPEPRGVAVGETIREVMATFIREAIAAETAAWRRGEKPLEPRRVFNRDCYIELSFDSRQLKAVRRYIKLNPARALWKLRHPDRFRRVEIPAEKLLGGLGRWNGRGFAPNPGTPNPVAPNAAGRFAPKPGAPNPVAPNPGATNPEVGGEGAGRSPVHSRIIHAMGDITLLGSPFFLHVRLTLKKTVAEHEAAISEIVAEAQRGKIPVSGFISPGEREALRRLKATPGARFVKLLPHEPRTRRRLEPAQGLAGCAVRQAVASRTAAALRPFGRRLAGDRRRALAASQRQPRDAADIFARHAPRSIGSSRVSPQLSRDE